MDGWKTYVLPLIAGVVLLLYFVWNATRSPAPETDTSSAGAPANVRP